MLEKINNLVWGNGTLLLILATGLYLTLKTRFYQLTDFRNIFSSTILSVFRKNNSESDGSGISPFKTFSTTLAATMGTGNIVGVAAAVTIGGAGAIFWMWASALLGMMIAYSENYLGTLYRYKNSDGAYTGGAIAYIEKGLGCKWLAVIYAMLCVCVSFGMGNMTQSSSISNALSVGFGAPPILTGAVTAVLCSVVIIGGIKRIGSIMQFLIPFVSIGYILYSLIIIIRNYENIPLVCKNIFSGAFGISAVTGGISGTLIKSSIVTGLRRGVFSNEAGLGTASLLHSASETKSPHVQGQWGIAEVFTDTILCCTLTAFALLCKGGSLFDGNGRIMMGICVPLFAFATLIGWSYCGELAVKYLFGVNAIPFYRILFGAAIFIGAVIRLETVWTLADIFNGLMAIPNLTAILLLSGKIKRSRNIPRA